MSHKDKIRNKIQVTSKHEDKTETNNQWASMQNENLGYSGPQEKTEEDNQWISTNKSEE